ncbi:MAG: hypothetical protein IJ123_00580 [Blautia sp.]|nr:hypothetical protein [Blautia sp.]
MNCFLWLYHRIAVSLWISKGFSLLIYKEARQEAGFPSGGAYNGEGASAAKYSKQN